LPLAATLSLAAVSSAEAAFRISTIANSRSELSGFGLPSVNASGDIAFSADFDVGSRSAVFRSAGATRTSIATTDGALLGFASDAVIDGSGVVSFVADQDAGGRAVLSGNGGALTTLASTGSDNITLIDPIVAANDQGDVLFAATTLPQFNSSGRGIYVVRGGVRTLAIAETFQNLVYGPIEPVIGLDSTSTIYFENLWNGIPRISETRTVPFYFDVVTTAGNCGGRLFSEVNLLAGGPYAGAVFRGVEASGRRGVYLQNHSGNCATVIADSAGQFADFTQVAAALDSSASIHVAFHASLDAGGSAIYAGEFGDEAEVIAVGDALDGSTVVDLALGRQPLGSGIDLTFWARLADGTTGIYSATPGGGSTGGGGGGGGVDGVSLLLMAVALGLSRAAVAGRRQGA